MGDVQERPRRLSHKVRRQWGAYPENYRLRSQSWKCRRENRGLATGKRLVGLHIARTQCAPWRVAD